VENSKCIEKVFPGDGLSHRIPGHAWRFLTALVATGPYRQFFPGRDHTGIVATPGKPESRRHIVEEGRGHFEKGKWVEGDEGSHPGKGTDSRGSGDPIEERIKEVSSLVSASFSELVSLARDMVATPEGHAHIRGYVERASSEIEKALSKIVEGKEEKASPGRGQDPGRK